jgi:thiosulfate reductase cytochrome b subunit
VPTYAVKAPDGRHLGSVFQLGSCWWWTAKLVDGRYRSRTADSAEQAARAIRDAHAEAGLQALVRRAR